ncbi:MAG: T9SS type A sorting domain-containing protein [Bacteroidales bacterium]|nr:T9SS type A sorting domain-containing protein [Bacteroidales bacterium]
MRNTLIICALLLLSTLNTMALNAPTLSSPSDGMIYTTSVMPTVSWSSVSGANKYILDWDTVSSFSSPKFRTFTTSYTYVSITELLYGTKYYWRVRAVKESANDTSDYSTVRNFTTCSAPTLTSPNDGIVYTSIVKPTVSWSTITGAGNYILEWDTVSSFSSPKFDRFETPSTSVSINGLQYGTKYYWRVKATNSDNSDTSNYSVVRNFTTCAAPILSSPNNGTVYSTMVRPTVSWNSMTGVGNYILEWDTVSTFSSPKFRSFETTSTSVNINALLYNTKYYWRVKATNSNDSDTSAYSEVWNFTTAGTVTLNSPSNNPSPTGRFYSRQYLRWNTLPGSSEYIIQLDTTPDFSSGALRNINETVSNANTDSYKEKCVYDLYYGTMYYWRVCAINAADTTDWSETWQFHTIDKVILFTPSNDTSAASGFYTRQKLQWKNSIGSTLYIIQLDTTPNFNSGLLRTEPYITTNTDEDTYLSKTFYNMRYGTMYYWRVCSANAADTSGWSATWQFHTLDWVTLNYPSNNTTGVSVSSRSLEWKNSIGSSAYIVQVDTSRNFNSELLRNVNVSSYETNTDTYKSTTITNLLYGTTYYWRVCAINEAVDTSGWSSVWNFTTAYQLTTAPTLVSPANGSNEIQPLGVELVWNGLDNVTGYRYQVSTDNTFATIYRSGTTANTTATCYLNYGTTYYWRVQGYNAAGNSVWSQVWSFDTQSCELTGETTAEACGSYVWHDTTYTESGDYNFTKHLSNGCDSLLTLHLTINQSSEREFSRTACESYTWNGQTYTESGDYVQNIAASNGCDSIVTLHLTINYPLTELVEVEACNSYQWYNQTYTESGDYQRTFTAANGCDSVVTLRLTINESPTREFAETSCVSYTWNGQTYTTSGTYTQNISSDNGCDSIVTLHLTINQPSTYQFEATACESYEWNGETYTASGNYQQTFTAANGCDSVVTLHLTINHPTTAEFAVSACDSYEWNGETYTESGDYTQTFTIANGCDSVVNLHLTINHPQAHEVEDESCVFYIWNGVTYTESGDYVQTLQTASGCDSVVTLHLIINETVTYEFDTSSNEYFVWNGEIYTETGDYAQAFAAANGCDSIVTLHLNVITGISEAEMQISIFPNPANEILNITSSEEISEIEIVNTLGQVVYRVEVNAENAVCDLENLPSGVYVVRIRTLRPSIGSLRQAQRAAGNEALGTPIQQKFVKE